jgi:hypothetical protein
MKRNALALLAGLVLVAGLPPLVENAPHLEPAPGPGRAETSALRPPPGRLDEVAARTAYGNLPLGFEQNRGQAHPDVRYLARARGYNLFLTDRQMVMVLATGRVLRFGLGGGAASPRLRALDQLPGATNYLGQSGRQGGRVTGVPTFGRISYQEVYPGIDQVFYSREGQLEYDLLVAPGADPGRIRLRLEGADRIESGAGGDLVMQVDQHELRLRRPVAWQEIDGRRVPVDCRYLDDGGEGIGLKLGDYDPRHRLIIDPVIQYATYVGGSAGDAVLDLAVDGAGQAYLTGWTLSVDYPVTPDVWQISHPGTGTGIFVAKLNPTGTGLVYSTYLGPAESAARSLALDAAGNLYLTGTTRSPAFPTTEGAWQRQPVGQPAWSFVSKLDARGAELLYSTYLTGAAGVEVTGIAIDQTGAAYLVGEAGAGFPTTAGAFQPDFKGGAADAFLASLNPAGTRLVYGTYLGGSDYDGARAVAVDGLGQAYVTGITTRAVSPTGGNLGPGFTPLEQIPFSDFPVTRGAFQTVPRGRSDSFVTKFRSDGAAVIYSTYLGGSADEQLTTGSPDDRWTGRTIAVDAIGNVHVVGTTLSIDFPTTAGAWQRLFQGGADAFVAKLNVIGSRLVYSTYLGGASREVATALAVDGAGKVYVTGWTLSSNFPVTADGARKRTPESAGVPAAFLTTLDPAGATLEYSTHLGGTGGEQGRAIAVGVAGSIHVAGITGSADFPVTVGTWQPQLAGQQDGFVVKFLPGGGPLELARIVPAAGGDGGTVWAILHGLEFVDGATVKLVRDGERDIPGVAVNVGADGRTVGVSLNLTGRTRGAWDVVVTNPDGMTATLRQGFTIEPARPGAVVLDSTWGPPSIRAGQKQQYWITYRHTGNNDLVGVPVWIKVRGNSTLRLVSDLAVPTPLPGEPSIDWNQISNSLNTADGGQTVPVVLAIIPPGRTGYLAVEIGSSTQVGTPIPFEVWSSPPIFSSFNGVPGGFNECYQTIIKGVGIQAGVTIPTFCETDLQSGWRTLLMNAIQASYNGQGTAGGRQPRIIPLNQLVAALATAAMRCQGSVIPVSQLNGAIARSLGIRDELRTCLGSRPGYFYWIIAVVRSYDPFFNLGLQGIGRDRHLAGSQPLSYAIGFENSPAARTNVREVIITEQLDLSIVDPQTFSFGPIAIGSRIHVPEPGRQSLTAEIDLRPTRNVMVRIAADLKPDLGQVVWRLSSIDPLTGLPPTDSTGGFLPPNSSSPQGAGAVGYTIESRSGLASGTVIANQPTIVFDQAPPVTPNPWTNRLDLTRPASRVEALPAVQQKPIFQVRWAGTDAHAGIRDYTVYVAVDQGEWTPWQIETTATAATFNGSLGRKYSFYSVARDHTLNIESPPLVPNSTEIAPDTSTLILNFDLGMQDDRTGDFLLFNSMTGEYYVSHCGSDSFSATGKAQIGQSGSMVTLTSAFLSARLEKRLFGQFYGEARFRQSSIGITYTIVDRSSANNTWRCSQ